MAQVFLALIVLTVVIAVADACKKALMRRKVRREHAKADAPQGLLR